MGDTELADGLPDVHNQVRAEQQVLRFGLREAQIREDVVAAHNCIQLTGHDFFSLLAVGFCVWRRLVEGGWADA